MLETSTNLKLVMTTIALTLAASAAWAEGADCFGAGDLKDRPDFAIAHVTGAPRTFFIKNSSDAKTCPAMTDACRDKSFLVPGDRVIVGPVRNGLVCAEYLSPKGLTRAGWLPEAKLEREPATPVAQDGWIGRWVQQEGTITVKPKGGQVLVHGDATFGTSDPDRVKRGAINVGEFDATVPLNGPDLAFTTDGDKTLPIDKGEDTDCRIWLRRLGPYLLADDNNNCGGMNVSFRGTYTRKP